MENRIYRIYSELESIEGALRRNTHADADAEERAQMLARIEELERRALELDMPISYSERSFNLKAHIRALMANARRDA
jgi:exonuclease VII small subunit